MTVEENARQELAGSRLLRGGLALRRLLGDGVCQINALANGKTASLQSAGTFHRYELAGLAVAHSEVGRGGGFFTLAHVSNVARPEATRVDDVSPWLSELAEELIAEPDLSQTIRALDG
jgi:hypothetical protein